jgi:hypothetical protein
MDEDIKTLLAVLALIYGSSNGIGLFKSALDPVATKRAALKTATDDIRTDETVIDDRRKELRQSLWSIDVLMYVLLVLVPTVFLLFVVVVGPHDALEMIGLASGASGGRGSTFYLILLALSLITSVQLLSGYLGAWGAFWKSRPKSG